MWVLYVNINSGKHIYTQIYAHTFVSGEALRVGSQHVVVGLPNWHVQRSGNNNIKSRET